MSSFGEFFDAVVIYCFCSNDCSMSDYKCLLAGGPDSENSHDLLPKLMEPQKGLMSPFRHQPHFQGWWGGGNSGTDTGLEVGFKKRNLGIPTKAPTRHLLHPEKSPRWHLDTSAALPSNYKAF